MSIYLKAAKIMHKDTDGMYGACDCIDAVTKRNAGDSYPEKTAFTEMFKPAYIVAAYWGAQWGMDEPDQQEIIKTVKECRILALLFAHAMEEE